MLIAAVNRNNTLSSSGMPQWRPELQAGDPPHLINSSFPHPPVSVHSAQDQQEWRPETSSATYSPAVTQYLPPTVTSELEEDSPVRDRSRSYSSLTTVAFDRTARPRNHEVSASSSVGRPARYHSQPPSQSIGPQDYNSATSQPTELPARDQSQPPQATSSRHCDYTAPSKLKLPNASHSEPLPRAPSTERSMGAQSVPPPHRPDPPTSAYRTTRSDTHVPQAPAIVEDIVAADDDSSWLCDFCMNVIPLARPRAHCTVCDDYDLCTDCYRKDRTSKEHLPGHKMRPLLRTVVLEHSDFVHPGEDVNPYLPFEDKQSTWSIDENDMRWNLLRTSDSHDRYLATNIAPGNYRVDLHLQLKLSNYLGAAARATLNQEGIGKLRIVIGFPRSKDIFLHESFPENDDLKNRLFSAIDEREFTLIPNNAGLLTVEMCTPMLTVSQPKAELGVLLQWIEVRGFANIDEPIAQMAIERIR